jgi:hypothetical protein
MSKYLYCTIQATKATFPEPEEGKKAYVVVDLQVTECQDSPERVGQVFTEYLLVSQEKGSNHDKSREITFEKLRALGWLCNDITELTGVGSLSAAGGIYEETYNGKSREKMNIWAKKAPKAAVSGAAKKNFAKMFKASAAAVGVLKEADYNAAVPREGLPDVAQKNIDSVKSAFGVDDADYDEDIGF